jgi:tetratricopeptide (TPR) repeat protein
MTTGRADHPPVRGASVLADSLAVNDAASLDDHLGFARFAVPLADYIAAMRPDQTPWTVGVYGEWGSGKTSFLKQVSAALTERGIEPVWFNAWKYAREEDLWQALIQTVLDQVRVAGPVHRRVWVKLRIWFRSLNLRSGLLDLSRKLFWLSFRIGLIVLALYMAATLVKSGPDPSALSALKGSWLADLLQQPWARAVVAIGATLAAKPESLFKIFDVRLGFDLSAFQKKRSYREKVAFLEEFSEDFRDIIRIVCRRRPLVVVIDDLDRCLPEQTLQIVETMKLFLDVQGCVFLVAVDRDIIENAVSVRYKDLTSQDALLRRISETYFEKIVQLPFSLPPVTADAADNLITQISSDDDVHQCLPILRGSPPFNPRRIKRMVQTFTLLKSLAGNALSDSPLVPPLLAKIVVIQTGYRDVYDAVIDDPGLLAALERSYDTGPADPQDTSPARILDDERARQFAARHPDLPALFRHRLSPSDSFTRVSASEYLSFVRAVVPTEVVAESAPDAPPTFTIWHLRADIAWAEWLARQLSDAGYQVQLGGSEVPRAAGYLVVVLSRQAAETVPAQQWAALRVAGARTLIARVAPVTVPEMLATEQALDLDSLREHEARAVLLSALDPRHRRPADLGATGSAPPVSALPYPGRGLRVTNVRQPATGLVSRRGISDRLARCLLANRADDSPTVCALIGMPGAGKSEAARHYAQGHADEYQVVWWIDGGEAGRVEAALRALAHELGGPGRPDADPLAVVGEQLAGTRRWLLILDGATDPDTLRPFLPLTGRGDVLVTTRRQSWSQTAHHVDVGPFDSEQAGSFLAGQLPDESEEELRALAEALGHLPSALDAAVRHLRLVAIPAHEFRKRLAADDPTLVERAGLLAGIRLLPAEVGPLAFVAPRPFPRALAGVSEETLGLLHEHSLAELTADCVRLHPLVQLAARTVLDPEQSREVVQQAITAIGQDPAGDVAGHLAALVAHGERLLVAGEEMHAGLVTAARGLLDAGSYVQAGRVARLAAERPAATPAERGEAQTLLGEAVLSLGGGAAAVPLVHRAPGLLVRARLQAGDIEGAAEVQNQLGGSDLAAMVGLAGINREGRPQVAHQLLAPTLEGYRQRHPDDALVARALVLLGGVLMQMDDLAAARSCFEEALQVQRRVLGPRHPEIAETLRPYAAVLVSLHEPQLARDSLEEAIALWEAVVGPRDRLLRGLWRQLADVARDLGDDAAAAQAQSRLAEEAVSAADSLTLDYQPIG